MSESILVLGGAGFIGSNFTIMATDQYDEVIVLDNLTYAGKRGNLDDISDEITFLEGDIKDRSLLNDLYERVEKVINFAAQTHVDRSIEDGTTFVRNNVEGAFTAFDVLRDHNIDRFVQISTDEVYGSISSGEYDETASFDPASPYSASKASSDLFVNAFWETYGLPISIARPTNVFGPRQHPEKLIPKFILRALANRSLPVYGDGTNVRQWLYVEDLCRGLLTLLARGQDEVYNFGGDTRKSNIEVTEAILREVNADKSLIEFVEDRQGHDQRYALDDTKARNSINFNPQVDFKSGLQQTVRWYSEHKEGFTEEI